MAIMKVIEILANSEKSWEDATKKAVKHASKSDKFNKMKNIFTVLLTLLSFGLNAQHVQEKYSKVKVSLLNKDIKNLAKLGLEVDHGILVKGRYLINDYAASELNQISNANFQFEVLVDDVVAWYQDPHRGHSHAKLGTAPPPQDCFDPNESNAPIYETPVNYTYGSMGGYLTYSEMLVVLDSMVAKFPNLITARAPIGSTNDTTWMGNRLQWLKISDNPNIDEPESEVLFTSLHHAREPNSLAQNIFYMWYLLENYSTDPEVAYLVDNTEIYFIPCINPDGYILNEQNNPNGGGMIRKNGRDNDNNGIYDGQDGVDLNRNYDFEWAYDNTGSSPNMTNQTYRGPSGFSEPETKAVRDFCNAHQFQIALNYHTYGNLLIHPWGYTDVITSEHETFKVLGNEMTQYNQYTFGTGSETVGYTVNGDSDDWFYGETATKPKIYSMTPEVGAQNDGFWPLQTNIDALNKSVMHQNLSVSRLVLNYVEGEGQNPGNFIYGYTGNFDFTFLKKGLKLGDVTVDFTSLSTDLSITFTPQILSLIHLQSQNVAVPYTVAATASNDDELKYVVSIDNGQYTYYDTIIKTFKENVPSPVFTDNTNDLSNWQTNSWALTTTDFYSSPNSITESPVGDYGAGEDKRITLTNSIDLTFASVANISFWAKWDIENDFDYTQVLISTDNGASYTPLCGVYSNAGTSDQDDGMPLYDGVQSDWVKEFIDISEYVGGPVLIQFYFHSDNFVHGDGFYFDDFEVRTIVDAHESNISVTEFTCDEALVTTEVDTLTNIWSLDSIYTVNTILANSYNVVTTEYTQDSVLVGTVIDTLTSINNCDSIIQVNTLFAVNSSILSLAELGIKVYPNPVKELLFIDVNNYPENIEVVIQNALGQRIESFNIANNKKVYPLDLSNYTGGLYFIKMKIEGQQKVVKFLKM